MRATRLLSFFVEAGETRLHSQVFANAKVACDARSRYDMRLASTALDAPLSLAIPSFASLTPYESRDLCAKMRATRLLSFFLRQEETRFEICKFAYNASCV